MKVVSVVLIILAVAACGSSGATSAPTSAGSSTGASAGASTGASTGASAGASAVPGGSDTAPTPLHVRDFKVVPGDLTVTGSTVSLAVTNDGPTIHNITIRDATGAILAATKDLRQGQSEVISVQLAAGSYIFYCSLPGHESLGIKGTLVVK